MSIFAFSIHLYLISMDPWIIEHAHTFRVHNSHFAKMLYDCLNFWLMIMSWTSHTHSYYSIKTKEMLCVSIVRMEQKANSIWKRKKIYFRMEKSQIVFHTNDLKWNQHTYVSDSLTNAIIWRLENEQSVGSFRYFFVQCFLVVYVWFQSHLSSSSSH